MKQDDFNASLKTIKRHLLNQEEKNIIEPIQNSLEQEPYCNCEDMHGNLKNLYLSQNKAQKEVKYLRETQQISLNIYPCPFESGWHLTKG